jgi:hypothetical protein
MTQQATARTASEQCTAHALRARMEANRKQAQREYLRHLDVLRRRYGVQITTETVVGHVGALIAESPPRHWLIKDCRRYLWRCLLKGLTNTVLTRRRRFT